MKVIVERWPVDDEEDKDAQLAINNAMNNLLGYPHGCEDVWAEFISDSPDEVSRIFRKWRGESIGRYVDGLS